MKHQVNNKLIERIQVRHGTIVNVNKYNIVRNWLSAEVNKNNAKRLYPGVMVTTKEVQDKFTDEVFPIGTHILFGRTVVEETTPNNYDFELKIAGGCISGNRSEMLEQLEEIAEIIKSYGGNENA